MPKKNRLSLLLPLCLCASVSILLLAQDPTPVPAPSGPLRPAQLLIRDGKTDEARKDLDQQRKTRPNDPELLFQIARSYLVDFYRLQDPERRRIALGLAMETLAGVLKNDPNHIPALRAKAVIHARAELLYYDPNLSYELANRVAKLEPHANAFLLNLSEWMSGEVRFTTEHEHRVPHDPLTGLDRSVELLERVIDETIPYSNEESAALFILGNTLSRRGSFAQAVVYYGQMLQRTVTQEQRMAALREMGACYYRTGDFVESARKFYDALQIQVNPVDQWLFRLALEASKEPLRSFPQGILFPAEDNHKIDPAIPPLLAFEN